MKKLLMSLAIILFCPCIVAKNTNLVYAPYKDMTLNAHWDNTTGTMVPESIAAISQQSGIKHFTLAFIVNGGGECTPSWGGSYPMIQTPAGKPEYIWGLDDINSMKSETSLNLSFDALSFDVDSA